MEVSFAVATTVFAHDNSHHAISAAQLNLGSNWRVVRLTYSCIPKDKRQTKLSSVEKVSAAISGLIARFHSTAPKIKTQFIK